MTKIPTLKLKSGHEMPVFGLGTWQSKPGEVGTAVRAALDAGYPAIDCAEAYMNQKEVGEVFHEYFSSGKVNRSDVFITTKLWNVHHSHEEASKAIDSCLTDLQLEYIDLLLIHWPQGYLEKTAMFPKDANGVMQNSDVDWMECWKAMEEAKAAGKIRSLGVSNFSRAQCQRLVKEAKEPLDNLQMEIHPYFMQKTCMEFCKAEGIVLTGYSPLASNGHQFRKEGQPNLLEEEVMIRIGKTHSKSPAQVALRWAVQHGMVTIPKSTNAHRIKENMDIFDFTLTDSEMGEVDGLDRNIRLLSLERDLKHPHYPFHGVF